MGCTKVAERVLWQWRIMRGDCVISNLILFQRRPTQEMQHSKLEVFVTRVREVTMSSRYNEADLNLSGPWIPEVPQFRWQNLSAQSPDGRYVTLVAWDILEHFDLVSEPY